MQSETALPFLDELIGSIEACATLVAEIWVVLWVKFILKTGV